MARWSTAVGASSGVNTFTRTSEQDSGRMNYALASEALMAFLSQNGINTTTSDQACRPQARSPQAGAPEVPTPEDSAPESSGPAPESDG